jgi:hypothetical protein
MDSKALLSSSSAAFFYWEKGNDNKEVMGYNNVGSAIVHGQPYIIVS